MKVLFTPYTNSNPYQDLLAEALNKLKIEVFNEHDKALNFSSLLFYTTIDVIHIHWTHRYLSATTLLRLLLRAGRFFIILLFLKLQSKKIVWTIHNLADHESAFKKIEYFLHRAFINCFCSRIIVHCERAKHEVINYYRLKSSKQKIIYSVPHGNYIEYYQNNITREEARSKLNIPDNNVMVFLYFGQIRAYKGVIELIAAFRNASSPNHFLLIAGKPVSENVVVQIKESIQGLNVMTDIRYIPDHETQNYMNACDVIALPYKNIFTSGTALLAMSFSKPVIAPCLGCMPEVLDEENNILYDPVTEDGLEEAIRKAIEKDLATMGKANFNKAKESYNWDNIAQKMKELYTS